MCDSLGLEVVPEASGGEVISCTSSSEGCKKSYLKPDEVVRRELGFSFQMLLLLAEPLVVQPRAEGWGAC